MTNCQPGILADETKLARYLTFSIHDGDAVLPVLQDLADSMDGDNLDGETLVLGIGESVVTQLGKHIDGLKVSPAQSAFGIDVPSTPGALWIWLRGNDRGELLHRSRRIEFILEAAFELTNVTDAFQYDANRDLTGYEDGTENPQGEEAIAAAVVSGLGNMDGSSFVAVQQWLHDLDIFEEMSEAERDDIIGRHIADNEEFDAPESAHVKRSAQESYSPEAFILRRSMPWADEMSAGLMFVAFGHSLRAFEAIQHRMLGKEDGVMDALYRFTRPMSSAYYWCPPMVSGKLDLSLLK